jgi:hypothetical protein
MAVVGGWGFGKLWLGARNIDGCHPFFLAGFLRLIQAIAGILVPSYPATNFLRDSCDHRTLSIRHAASTTSHVSYPHIIETSQLD